MGKWPSLDKIELKNGSIGDKEYVRELRKLQHQLLDLQIHHHQTGGRVVIGIDGWDAAGKGGLIQRMIYGLEPRSTHVWRIGAPTEVEQGRHYLWRFWERLPARRNWAIFDRTWYGRVLVERIEGFCTKEEWKRAYREINEFERQLTDDGVHIVKFLIHVSPEEQKRRMIERLEDPHKRHKLGIEDFRTDYEQFSDTLPEEFFPRGANWLMLGPSGPRRLRLPAGRCVLPRCCTPTEA